MKKPNPASLEDMTQRVYAFMCDYYQQNGLPPSIEEIAHACYLSPTTTVRHLDRLEGRGWISRKPGVARGIVFHAIDVAAEVSDDDPQAS